MAITIRRATDADLADSARLSYEAFGYKTTDPSAALPLCSTAQITYLAQDEHGRVIGKCRDRFYDSWFGGQAIATAGVASVAVEPEARGKGVMRQLISGLMLGAQERGAAISCLVPTVAGMYRRFGYETIVTTHQLKLPTSVLSKIKPSSDQHLSTRRATPEDFGQIQQCYQRWASGYNGPLTRTGPSFADASNTVFENTVTVVESGDEMLGYLVWSRSGGYGNQGVIEVHDFIAVHRGAAQTLLALLGASYAVAPTTEISISGIDQLRMIVGDRMHFIDDQEDYMCAILNVEEAFSQLTYPIVDGVLEFQVVDAFAAGVAGNYRLRVAAGVGSCQRVVTISPDALTLSSGGLACLFAGSQTMADLVQLGLADRVNPLADLWFRGRTVRIADSF